MLCPASAEQSTPARQIASEPRGTASRKIRVALRHSMKTFDSWNQTRCLRGDVAPRCAPPRNRNLKTAKPCSPGAPPAAKTTGGSPPSCVKGSSADSIGHGSPRKDTCIVRHQLTSATGVRSVMPQGPKRSIWAHRTIHAFCCGPIVSQFASRIELSQNRLARRVLEFVDHRARNSRNIHDQSFSSQ